MADHKVPLRLQKDYAIRLSVRAQPGATGRPPGPRDPTLAKNSAFASSSALKSLLRDRDAVVGDLPAPAGKPRSPARPAASFGLPPHSISTSPWPACPLRFPSAAARFAAIAEANHCHPERATSWAPDAGLSVGGPVAGGSALAPRGVCLPSAMDAWQTVLPSAPPQIPATDRLVGSAAESLPITASLGRGLHIASPGFCGFRIRRYAVGPPPCSVGAAPRPPRHRRAWSLARSPAWFSLAVGTPLPKDRSRQR
jgi:hypothetical protein